MIGESMYINLGEMSAATSFVLPLENNFGCNN